MTNVLRTSVPLEEARFFPTSGKVSTEGTMSQPGVEIKEISLMSVPPDGGTLLIGKGETLILGKNISKIWNF